MTAHCVACSATVDPVLPSLGARCAFGAAAVATASLTVLSPFLGFAMVMAAPLLAAGGMALGPLADAAFQPPRCPRCDRRVEPSSPRVASSEPVRAGRFHGDQPSRAGGG
jgi:hypothetical protein